MKDPKSGSNLFWKINNEPVAYDQAIKEMENHVQAMIREDVQEQIWFLEHPPLYTLGTSGDPQEIYNSNGLPVYQTNRGGRATYHGPGQRIGYIMINLKKRGLGLDTYIHTLEKWLILCLGTFGIHVEARPERIGVWVPNHPLGEAKIAAIGIRIRQGITFHGFALNVKVDLKAYEGIVPCGLPQYKATSLADLGIDTTMSTVDHRLRETFFMAFQ